MPSRDDYKYRYVIEADGTLPGASFRDQTEDFLNAIDTDISGADGDASAAMAKALEALAAAEAAQGAVATLDQNCLHKSGNETATGTKTFTASPVVPTQSATDNSTKAVNSAWIRQLFSTTGGFSFGDDGKVYVDFNSMDPAIMRGIVLAMVQEGGGIGVDANGQLFVDFENMPTDKFEAMLAAIHVPVWIGENGVGTEFYVNGTTGVDSEGDGRGKSASKPWATIGYATQTICKNYNINNKTVHINVAGGTYTEAVALPLQQRTTGSIVIRPATASDTVNCFHSVTAGGYIFQHTGGKWVIKDLNLKLIINEQTSSGPTFPMICQSTDASGSLEIRHCNMAFEDNSVAPVSGSKGQVYARLIDCNTGLINIANNPVDNNGTPDISQYETTWSGSKGNANVVWIYAENGGVIQMLRPGASASRGFGYNVSGAFTTFAAFLTGALYRNNGTGSNAIWNKINTPTGRQYDITSAAYIATGAALADVDTYFPGTIAGVIDKNAGAFILPNNEYPLYLATEQTVTGPKVFLQGPFGTTEAVSAASIDLSQGSVFTKTISANTTLTFTGVPTGKAATFSLVLTNGGAYPVTWPANVKWTDDTPPDFTPSGKDVLTFMTPDGGTTWYGSVALSGVGVSA